MILPTKHLSQDKALLTLGADILDRLETPQTVSALWDGLRLGRKDRESASRISYNWFILSLVLLYTMGAVEFHRGTIRRVSRAS